VWRPSEAKVLAFYCLFRKVPTKSATQFVYVDNIGNQNFISRVLDV